MARIIDQTHAKETFLYSISRMLERTSYYGLRAIIVLFMTNGFLKMEGEEALTIYGWFTFSFVFSKIIGAIIGDLIIGNKNAVLIGAIIQSIGAFSFCVPSALGLYTGLFLVILGGGLYTPNLISNFGKLYLDKTKLLVSGFTILYLFVNIGAALGVLSIGYVGEKYGWNYGFILSGIMMLLSIVPVLYSKEKEVKLESVKETTLNKRIVKVLVVFILVAVYWAGYRIGSVWISDLHSSISEIVTLKIPKSMWMSLDSYLFFPVSIVLIILWTYFYSSQMVKLAVGFLFGAVSFGVLFLLPETPIEMHMVFYLISLLLLSISKVYISPIVHSALTQYSNPKYLAILISLAFIPTRLLAVTTGIYSDEIYDNPILGLKIGLISMLIIGVGLMAYNFSRNKKTN